MKDIKNTTPYKEAEYRRKWQEINRERNKEYNKKWRATGGQELMWSKEVQKKYWPDLTRLEAIEEYNAWFKAQDGRCAICQTHQDEMSRRMCVDHCHDTLQIRGLLCGNCNIGIGKLGDTYKGLVSAAKYLWKFEQEVKGVI